MPLYLSIQSTYEQVEVGLWSQHHLLATCSVHKFNASRDLITHIAKLLSSHSRTLNDLAFIGINQGPGPFTTLRVTIATVNGIAFATGIPLVGIHGLQTFVTEYHSPTIPVTVALLNAFNKDVYYAIASHDQPISIGVDNYMQVLQTIKEQFPHTPIQYIGNGTAMYRIDIEELFKDRARIAHDVPPFPSLQAIANQSLIQWHDKININQDIQPYYLKNYSAIIHYPSQ
jgi:tRNA threonylcarbamoyladenosine biosynthesis protein TsaB